MRGQAIRSSGQNQRLCISFPMALAAAMGLEAGEEVEWEILDRGERRLIRPNVTAPAAKAKARR